MSNSFVIWLGNLLGIGAGPAVALCTVLILVGYVLGFWLLLQLLIALKIEYNRSGSTPEKALLVLLMLPIGAVVFVLDVIHTIFCIWFGVRALAGLHHYIEHTR